MRKLFFRVFSSSQVFSFSTQFQSKIFLQFYPFFKQRLPIHIWVNQIFYFHLFKFNKNCSRSFWSQKNRFFYSIHFCLEHHIEIANIGPVKFSASGTFYFIFLNSLVHLFVLPFHINTNSFFHQVICSKSFFTFFTINHCVAKSSFVS